MTRTKAPEAWTGSQPDNNVAIKLREGETGAQALARTLMEPNLRHALTASVLVAKALGDKVENPGLMDFNAHIQAVGEKAERGDLAIASRMLAAQAMTLDSMFTELARRAGSNVGEYRDSVAVYGRLALKAQANCRATLEALARLHQPREQTVRHVHVNEGGQAIVADHFHQNPGAIENGKSVKQSDATELAGGCAALPRPDPSGIGVPVSSRVGQEAMPDARWDQPRPA